MKKKKILWGIAGILIVNSFIPILLCADGTGAKTNGIKVPDDAALMLTRVYSIDSTTIYATSVNKGFLVSWDSGKSWWEKNNGLPQRVVYPFDGTEYRRANGLGVDFVRPKRVALTTATAAYFSENGGDGWHSLPLNPPLAAKDVLTAIALSTYRDGKFLVGTSFDGCYETTNGGKQWTRLCKKDAPFYQGGNMYEEIAALAYSPEDENTIYLGMGFGEGLYKFSKSNGSYEEIMFPGSKNHEKITAFAFRSYFSQIRGTLWQLEVSTDKGLWHYYLQEDGRWEKEELQFSKLLSPGGVGDQQREDQLKDASAKYGIYLSSFHASGKSLDDHIKFMQKNKLNTLVVDLKDDEGVVTYNSTLELAKRLGAVKPRVDIEELVKKAHANRIYLVARLVCFKDPKLYNFQNFKYAVIDGKTQKPWRYLTEREDAETGEVSYFQREYWVDPYSEFAWNYNISLARELQELGVDEIQFDYIRFPTDGPIWNIHYRYRKPGMLKTEAIESFLKLARGKISIPISTDLYGFNSWFRMGNFNGQNIEMISRYVDVICPMFYPSHFPKTFDRGQLDYTDWARMIYEKGTARASFLTHGLALIRPYVQAFLIGSELNMEKPTYTDYLLKQIEGTMAAHSSGFTLWNASNRYYMVTVPLVKYISSDEEKELPAHLD